MTPGLVVDLFSGTGGATVAFAERGWSVVRLDLDRTYRPSIVGDVRRLPLRGERPIELLWASPPCTEFSEANPDNRARRPSLELVTATLNAVADLRPRFWVMENVRGAIPYLGIPVQKVGPWCLWGYFPPLEVNLPMHDYRKGHAGRSAAARAAVPRELSEALYTAIVRYRPVPSLLDMRPFRRHRHVAARRTAADDGSAPLLDSTREPAR